MRWFEYALVICMIAFGICAYLAAQSAAAVSPQAGAAMDTYIQRVATMLVIGLAMYLIMMRHTRAWIKSAGALLLGAYSAVQALVLWLRATQPDANAPSAAVALGDVDYTLVSSLDVALAFASAGLVMAYLLVFAIATMLRMAGLWTRPSA